MQDREFAVPSFVTCGTRPKVTILQHVSNSFFRNAPLSRLGGAPPYLTNIDIQPSPTLPSNKSRRT